ncbi:MAG: PAS domain S-box protein [Anaerolineae bacterium]
MTTSHEHLQTLLHRSEEARRSSERLFQTMIEKNADGILIVDNDGVIRFANPAAEALFGRRRETLVGESFGFPVLDGEATEIDLHPSGHKQIVAEMRAVEITWEGERSYLISLRDVTEYKEATQRIAHLNAVLQALRNVNQVIVRIHDQEKLVQAVCEELVKTHGYFHAWIALFATPYTPETLEEKLRVPEEFDLHIASLAEAGQDESDELMSQEQHRQLAINCCKRTLAHVEELLIFDDPRHLCPDCPLSTRYGEQGAMLRCLAHAGEVFGVLAISMPQEFLGDAEERALFEEVTSDIALALHNLRLEARQREAEARLRQNARLNARLLDSLPHPAMLIRTDRIVLAANRSAKKFGAEVGNYCWRSFRQCTYLPEADKRYIEEHGHPPPGGTACTFCRADEMARTGEAQRLPALEVFDRIWDTWWIPIDEETYLHYTLDITERLEMERALRASERKLDQMLQTMADGMVMVDTEGAIIYANSAAEDILEVKRDEILQRYYDERVWQQIDEAGEPYPPGQLPLALALREQRTVKELEHGIVAPSGEVKWLSVSAAPLIDENGEVYGAVANFRDVSERKAIEEALRTSEQRYRTLFEHAGDAIFVHDLEGRFLDVNAVACEQLGYSRQELLQMTPLDISVGTSAEELHRYLEDLREAKDIVFEGEHRRRDGSTFPVEISGRYIGYDGQPAVLSIVRDITERKEAARRIEQYAADLARSNRELEQFAYTVSHDLQEPTRMVSSYLTLLKRRYGEKLDEKGQLFIHYAVDGAERMQEMIQALLNLSRVETHGGSLEPTDSQTVVERTLTVLDRAIAESEARVTYAPLPTVQADRAQLAQVFQNLIANALKFKRDDTPPRIHIAAERQNDEWVFSVSDNGIGIDPTQADRIFEIFQRLHTREEYAGTGIGLALCKKIVERHGGRIWVESEPEHGATFYFTLPA